jgi:hypothetical protein
MILCLPAIVAVFVSEVDHGVGVGVGVLAFFFLTQRQRLLTSPSITIGSSGQQCRSLRLTSSRRTFSNMAGKSWHGVSRQKRDQISSGNSPSSLTYLLD